MENKRVTVFDTIKRGKWVFRLSLVEDEKTLTTSIMITHFHMSFPSKIYIRFFNEDEKAAAYVDECSAGKYGDVLE